MKPAGEVQRWIERHSVHRSINFGQRTVERHGGVVMPSRRRRAIPQGCEVIVPWLQ